jgi:hypothetical protein
MSFWRNLFLKNRKEKLNNSAKKRVKIPRAERVKLVNLHRISFHPKTPPFADTLTLANLSATGIGFIRGEITNWPKVGQIMSGTIEMETVPYQISVKIARETPDVIGGSWVDPSPSFLQLIHRYFEAELAALKLHEINPRFIKQPDNQNKARWIQGDNNCELYIEKQSEQIDYFNLLLLGNYAEGGEGKTTRFGSMNKLERDKPLKSASQNVEWIEFAPDELKESICKFISNISSLSPSEISALTRMIRKNS